MFRRGSSLEHVETICVGDGDLPRCNCCCGGARVTTDSAFLYAVLQRVRFSSDAGPVERVKPALFGYQLAAA